MTREICAKDSRYYNCQIITASMFLKLDNMHLASARAASFSFELVALRSAAAAASKVATLVITPQRPGNTPTSM